MEQVWSYLLNKKLSFKRPFRVNIHQNLHAGPPWKSSPRRPDSIRRYGCFFNWPASVPVKKFFETPTKQQTKQLPVLSHFHQLSPSQWSNFQVHENAGNWPLALSSTPASRAAKRASFKASKSHKRPPDKVERCSPAMELFWAISFLEILLDFSKAWRKKVAGKDNPHKNDSTTW